MKNKLVAMISALLIASPALGQRGYFPFNFPPSRIGNYETVEEKKEGLESHLNDLDLSSCELRVLGIKSQACTSYSLIERGLYFYLDCSSSEEGSLESYCSGIFCTDDHQIYFTPINSNFYLYIEMDEQQLDEFENINENIENLQSIIPSFLPFLRKYL